MMWNVSTALGKAAFTRISEAKSRAEWLEVYSSTGLEDP